MDAATLVDYAKSLDCVHCGLCLQSCPTYRLTGRESSSPRGRVHLMRSVAEGEAPADADFAEEMEFCLLCRGCESVCPSGVQFGRMMETTRGALSEAVERPLVEQLSRSFGFATVLPSRAWLSFLAGLGRFAQQLGLPQLAGQLLGERGAALASMPTIPPANERALLPEHSPAEGPVTGEVAVLEGCVMPELFGRVNRATVRCLTAAGREVHCSRGATCCGSLHAHNGELDLARRLTRETVEAHEALEARVGTELPLVVNSAGCAAHLVAADHLFEHDADFAPRARAFARKVVDFSASLDGPALERLAARLSGGPARRVAWDDPCHLCHGQGVRDEPRRLIDLLPSVERVPLEDSEACCGSAGIYSVLRPDTAAQVFAPKREAFERSGADCLVTANPGCQLQWDAGLRRAGVTAPVLHIAELVAERLPDAPRSDGA
ncbi:MAG: 4Fe-4S dicluster domain-containing protein [Planctomycetes bacterium]|nr:4Fe-4S dicluster domain-containing protein [Planctomycetota bacterium]MCB9904612.1 4Fe-4S dicluster domain-containing protein [Planctomycetota bacterium]